MESAPHSAPPLPNIGVFICVKWVCWGPRMPINQRKSRGYKPTAFSYPQIEERLSIKHKALYIQTFVCIPQNEH